MNNITNYRTFQRNRNEFVVEALFEDINNQWLIINHSGEYAGFPAEIAITYKTKEEAENAIRIFESSNPNFQRSTNENTKMDYILNYRICIHKNKYFVKGLVKTADYTSWLPLNAEGEIPKNYPDCIQFYKTHEQAENAIKDFESLLTIPENTKMEPISLNEKINLQLAAINEFIFANLGRNYFVHGSHVNFDGIMDQSLSASYNVPVDTVGPMALMFESITLKITTIYWPEVNVTTLKLAYSYELASGGSNGSSVEYVCDQTGKVTTRDEYWKNRKDFVNNL